MTLAQWILAAIALTVGTARCGAGWHGSDLWLWSLTLALAILAVVAQNVGSHQVFLLRYVTLFRLRPKQIGFDFYALYL